MPEAFNQHRERGFELVQEGRLEEAIIELRAARNLNPEDAWTRRSLGGVLSQTGQNEAAIAEYRESVRLQPDDEESHQHLVFWLIKAGRSSDAFAAVRKALVLCTSSPCLYSYFGYLLGMEADKTKDTLGWEAAAAAFQRCIEIDPADFTALHSLGVLYWRLQKKQEAIATLKAAAAVNPSNLKTLDQLGRYQAQTENFLGAFQTIRAIIKLPESEELQQYFAESNHYRTSVLFAGACTAAVLAGVWIWRRRG